MVARGERIGDAYVKIHGDGSDLRGSLRDDLNRAGEDAGKEFNKGFEKGFNEDFDDEQFAKNFDKALGKMAGRLDRLDLIRDDIRHKFEDTFDGDLGKKMADNLIHDLEEGLKGFDAKSLFGDLDRQVREATKQLSEEEAKRVEESIRLDHERIRELIAGEERWAKETEKIRAKDMERLRKDIEARSKEWADMLDEALKLNEAFDKKLSEDRDRDFEMELRRNQRLGAELDKWPKRTADAAKGWKRLRAAVREFSPDLDAFTKRWDSMADSISGKGERSRNNFVNAIRVSIAALTKGLGRLITFLPRLVGGFKEFGAQFSEIRKNGGTVMDALRGSASGLFSTLSTGLPGLIAVVAGLGALVAVAGLVVTLLSGLVAIITALAGSIAFALVGALGALLGALLPLGAAIGVIVLGFTQLSDAQKKVMANDLKPLVKDLKDLGDLASRHLFADVGKWAKDIKPLISEFRPAVIGIADAIRNTITKALDEATKSPGFKAFMDDMNKFLPKAVSKLGDAITNVFGGLGGIFRSLIPITNSFLNWLVKITDEFSNWANSAEGQKELKNFFSDAAESAKALGGFLKNVTKFLGELLSQGKNEGDTIFNKLSDAFAGFITWARSREGQKAIDRWLQFGKDLADSLGDAIKAAADLWDALDTPENRQFLIFVLNSITKIIELMSQAPGLLFGLVSPIGTIIGLIQTVVNLFGEFSWGNFFQGFIDGLPIVGSVVRTIKQIPAVMDSASRVAQKFMDFLSRVGDAIHNLPTAASTLFDRAIDGAKNLWNWIGQVVSRIGSIRPLQDIAAVATHGIQVLIAWVRNLWNQITSIPLIKDITSNVTRALNGVLDLIHRIEDALAHPFNLTINILKKGGAGILGGIPGLGGLASLLGGDAAGGIFEGMRGIGQIRRIGEAGPEAVVPLDRPLSLVDPSVRFLSAIAQGMKPPVSAAGDTFGGGGRQIVVPEISVHSAAEDPRAVAQEVMNMIVGVGY